MFKIDSLTKREIREFAEAYTDYKYSEGERGLFFLFPDKETLIDYLSAMINVYLECGMVYGTGKEHEGIVILTDTTHPAPFFKMLKLFRLMIKTLTFKGFQNFIKHAQAGGGSIEGRYRKEKRQFVQVELLAVRRQYQGQGHMRKLLDDNAFELADMRKLPCIIITDDTLKKDKYVHLGMTLVNTRKAAEGAYLYDMVREYGR